MSDYRPPDHFYSVIGYENVKQELREIADMIKNISEYRRLGASWPHGLILYGEPGVGKTMMATAFVKECGVKSYTLRRTVGTDEFLHELKAIFKEAAANTPSVILLDDMDKFVADENKPVEYNALQACMDEVKDSGVFVIGTVNETRGFPPSLMRSGRFDRKIEVGTPTGKDAVNIVHHYLSGKKLADDVNFSDVAKMMSRKSCADLEGMINEAAIYAGYEQAEKIGMKHLVRAVLRNIFKSADAPDWEKLSDEDKRKTAYHEAGHAVVLELLSPGNVGIISIKSGIRFATKGFVGISERLKNISDKVVLLLAGKAAVEMALGQFDNGAHEDLSWAISCLTPSFGTTYGADYLRLGKGEDSESATFMREVTIRTEIERYTMMARKMLAENRAFLDAVANELLEKETLLNSDMARLRTIYLKEKEKIS